MKQLNAFLFLFLILQSCNMEDPRTPKGDSLVSLLQQPAAANGDSLNAASGKSPGDTSHIIALPPVLEGDIIFQDAKGHRGDMIRDITKGKYTHCGMIFVRKRDNQYVVAEAGDSVCVTPLQQWIDSGQGQHLAIYRFKDVNMMMTKKRLDKIKASLKRYRGLPGDAYFSWTSDAMYSCELVWKAYHDGTGYRLSEPKTIEAQKLTGASVSKKLKEKYGNKVPAIDSVVMPEDLMNSPLLEKAFER